MKISDELMCRSVRVNLALKQLKRALEDIDKGHCTSAKHDINVAIRILEQEQEVVDALIREECEKLQSL